MYDNNGRILIALNFKACYCIQGCMQTFYKIITSILPQKNETKSVKLICDLTKLLEKIISSYLP